MDFKKRPRTDFKDIKAVAPAEARREIQALREGIRYHDELYYVKDKPVISDETYDKLFRRLQDLEKAFPQFASGNSPTKRVGGRPAAGLAEVVHTAPMLSLNSVYKDKDVDDFDAMVRREAGSKPRAYTAEPKFDGLSVEVVYENGAFARAATRGDGQTGEDISRNIRTIKSVPLHLKNGARDRPSFLAVRGEVFMRRSEFQKLNKRRIENGDEPFANPRNAAAGSVRQLDPARTAGIPLDIMFYDVLDVRGHDFSSQWNVLKQLPQWGLKTDAHNTFCRTLEAVKRYHAAMAEARDTLDYEIDGVVIKLDDFEERAKMGMRQRSPRWALAWKFTPKQEITVLRDIVVQVGRTGILTPVALLDPVNVGGVTVSRATLHNEDEVRRRDLRSGDTVRVVRAGDVIPEVVERVGRPGRRGKPFVMPGRCPSCGTKVVHEGAYYYCPNALSCRAQLIGRIAHFSWRGAMDIAGLGGETVKELVDRGLVKSVAGLYRLTARDFLGIEGFAQKSAGQLAAAIQRAKTARLDRFLYALGIPGVGEHAAQSVANHFKTLEALQAASLRDLEAVKDIGGVTARGIFEFLHEKDNRRVLADLRKAGLTVTPMATRRGPGPLDDRTFVFTGGLEHFARDEAKRLVEALGGRVASVVSARTDFVVVGRDPGSKLDEARAHGVKTIDEAAFTKLVKSGKT